MSDVIIWRLLLVTIAIISYNVFEVKDPYLSYKINVTVQQLDYKEYYTNLVNNKNEKRDIWRTVGFAEIGPETIGQNTNQNQVGKASGPEVSKNIK